MARYIDADKAIDKFSNATAICRSIRQTIDEVPTVDLAPKSEVAREIFMQVDCITHRYLNDMNYSVGEMLYDLDELKKKYTDEQKG